MEMEKEQEIVLIMKEDHTEMANLINTIATNGKEDFKPDVYIIISL